MVNLNAGQEQSFEELMYGARAYLAYLGYGAMWLFQDEITRGHGNFWSLKKKEDRSRIAINIARPLMLKASQSLYTVSLLTHLSL